MKKIYAIIMLAATLIACSREEQPKVVEKPDVVEQPGTPKTYTLAVSANKNTGSRALSIDDSGAKNVLNATWAEGEAVTVYNVTRNADLTGTLVAQSSGANTTLKGTLTGTIENNDQLKLKFLSPSYLSQDGTLTGNPTSIDKVCDYAEATVIVSDASTASVTTNDASFENKQAIVRFKLRQSDGTTPLSTSRLTVNDGTTTYTVTPTSATDVLFVAIPGFASGTVRLTARVDDDLYTYKRTSVTFSNGQYYEITVRMNLQGAVGLGLPSGTKWATCNIGAVDPEDYGDYYAWGATETWYTSLGASPVWKSGKEGGYIIENTPYYSNGTWTKYNLNSTLETIDDAASANWGLKWHMPTAEQWNELMTYCSFMWTQKNGVYGALVTRDGYSGELFLPAAGILGNSLGNNGVKGFYFTASQGNYANDSRYTLYYQFPADNSNTGAVYDTGRYFGLSIRPVTTGAAFSNIVLGGYNDDGGDAWCDESSTNGGTIGGWTDGGSNAWN